MPGASVLSYLDWFDDPIRFERSVGPGVTVRLESPGENFEVERRILAFGGWDGAANIREERGRILEPRIWFRGFARLMETLVRQNPEASWFNHPADIVSMFDKSWCKRNLSPHTLPPLPEFHRCEEFRAFVRGGRRSRYFVKLNSGSSASGIVAYARHPGTGQEVARTTIEMARVDGMDAFFNTLRIRTCMDHREIGRILDFVFSQGGVVEPWIPKRRHEARVWDLRALGVDGKRRHSVVRLSRGPMTNLHLGNQRASPEEMDLSEPVWESIDRLVSDVCARFPRSLYAGLDIALPRDSDTPVLFEANAFGDLLPGCLDRGVTTHRAEIDAVLQRIEDRERRSEPWI